MLNRLQIGVLAAVVGIAVAACAANNDDASPESDSVAAVSSEFAPPSRSESTVVIGAQVYTVDADQPWAAAFSYDADGVVTAVGSTEMVMAAGGANPTVIDASGSMIVPGFQDTHVHVLEAGINDDLCFMPASQSLDQYEALASECADRQPDAEWVLAAGPSLFELRDTDELPIDVLDRAIPDRPALILDDLGHAVWANTLALEAAGIGPADPNPQGGVLHRDVDTGRLTGLVLENAQQLLRNAAAIDDESVYAGLLRALDELTRNGVTSVSDAGGFWAQNHPAAWQRALADGELTVRAANSLYVYPDLDVELQLAEFERRFSNDSDLLRFDTAKIYVDGILDLGTAALLEPYDVPINPLYPSGFNYFTPDQLRTYVNELHALGYRVSFHVIGDAAVRSALDAVEAIIDTPEAIADRRHRTTHTYLVDDDDLNRFVELGIVADFQQSADAIDIGYSEYLSDFIGDRAFDLIPTAKVLETGADVSLSSDWDAGPLPPLGIIERSLTRANNAVPNLETAIALVTIDAAYALGHDDVTGSLTVGKFADFAVLDRNIFEVDVGQISRTEVLATFLAGTATFATTSFGS